MKKENNTIEIQEEVIIEREGEKVILEKGDRIEIISKDSLDEAFSYKYPKADRDVIEALAFAVNYKALKDSMTDILSQFSSIEEIDEKFKSGVPSQRVVTQAVRDAGVSQKDMNLQWVSDIFERVCIELFGKGYEEYHSEGKGSHEFMLSKKAYKILDN